MQSVFIEVRHAVFIQKFPRRLSWQDEKWANCVCKRVVTVIERKYFEGFHPGYGHRNAIGMKALALAARIWSYFDS